jgi:soluble lytic murein transglycosylase
LTKLLSGLLLTSGLCAVVFGIAQAQTEGDPPAGPVPYGTLPGARTSASPLITAPGVSYSMAGQSESTLVNTALAAAKSGDSGRIRAARDAMSDSLDRKIALWALVDSAPTSVSFMEADSARRDLMGWPRAAKRQATAERLLGASGLSPQQTIAWFGGDDPATAEGALALGSAYRATGQTKEAASLIRRFWRDKIFEADVQSQMLARFGDLLTQDDHVRRADILLYGQQGQATRDVVALLSGDQRALAQARMDLRNNGGMSLDNLPYTMTRDPGLVLERMAWLRRRGQNEDGLVLARTPAAPPTDEAAARVWAERKPLVAYAMGQRNWAAAYAAADGAHLTSGSDAADCEFLAGWIALTKLNDPDHAALHFANLASIGSSPITRGRALYWQGRAAEAQGDPIAAQTYYAEGSRYITSFYGQLAAEKAGQKTLVLDHDPEITQADRARFEGREPIRAARLLAQIGARDTFRVFVLAIDDTLPTAAEEALLVDMARSYGEPDLAMRAVRTAAQRGLMLWERGYPVLSPPNVSGAAETAFVLSITRQESNFDPAARSAPGARGMMQLMPATAASTARKLGESYSADRLFEADYNMRLGAANLGEMVATFNGSYLMAAAAYNAGPGRPTQWVATCGDPRGSGTDPVDYIECIPFSETRNYVMRTLETTMIYRARLNGGRAPLTLTSDLKRGGYGSYAVVGPPSGGR